jgi:ParB/RepB/Spo0J family partition protein
MPILRETAMSASPQLRLNPNAIVVSRETRQRQENISDIEDLKQSIKTVGLINLPVVRRVDSEFHLVAGERRLKAVLELGWTEVDVRSFEDLSPEEAEIVELEENVKRKELAWRDQVRAVGRIHALYRQQNGNGWKIEQTADAISLHHSHVRKILHVFGALSSGRIDRAESIEQAFNTIHRFSERKAEAIVGDLIVKGAAIFGTSDAASAAVITEVVDSSGADLDVDFTTVSSISVAEAPPTVQPAVVATPTADPIVCADFTDWIKTYAGPKFSLIHCDFPYGNYRGGDSQGAMSGLETEDFYDNTESVYWNLVEALTSGLERIMSYSAHMLFWFNMNFYTETVKRFRTVGLMVHDHPLVWHKTGGPGGLGVVPGTAVTYPRRTYDTALLCVRGNRPLAKPGMGSYAAPTVGNKIHPSQKSEPMLRAFLSMLVDETSTVLDPCCGSAAALRAAEDCGAKSILGLELDPNYAQAALTRTLQARILRQAGTMVKDEVL